MEYTKDGKTHTFLTAADVFRANGWTEDMIKGHLSIWESIDKQSDAIMDGEELDKLDRCEGCGRVL